MASNSQASSSRHQRRNTDNALLYSSFTSSNVDPPRPRPTPASAAPVISSPSSPRTQSFSTRRPEDRNRSSGRDRANRDTPQSPQSVAALSSNIAAFLAKPSGSPGPSSHRAPKVQRTHSEASSTPGSFKSAMSLSPFRSRSKSGRGPSLFADLPPSSPAPSSTPSRPDSGKWVTAESGSPSSSRSRRSGASRLFKDRVRDVEKEGTVARPSRVWVSSPLAAAVTSHPLEIEVARKAEMVEDDVGPQSAEAVISRPVDEPQQTEPVEPVHDAATEQSTPRPSPAAIPVRESPVAPVSALSPETSPPESKKPPDTILNVAQKIRGLMHSLPGLSRSAAGPSNSVADRVIVDGDGRPIGPPGSAELDPELISILSNSSVMSGSGGNRESVWSMLDAISPPPTGVATPSSVAESYDFVGSDRSSVMMYSPLIPGAGSVVELAEQEEIIDSPLVTATELGSPGAPAPQGWFSSVLATWSFSGRQADAEPPRPVRRWKPSITHLSFETIWWGYRIYLPPPVLDILDDQSVEAARRATVITAALTWFFSNLPITAFPPPLQPAMVLLQRLVPLGSYLGTFISWSWSTIRGFDQGHGVILTATWLLPIAVIPGTWHSHDVPLPSPAPNPPVSLLQAMSEIYSESDGSPVQQEQQQQQQQLLTPSTSSPQSDTHSVAFTLLSPLSFSTPLSFPSDSMLLRPESESVSSPAESVSDVSGGSRFSKLRNVLR